MATRDFSALKDLLPGVLGQLARDSGSARGLKPIWDEVVGPSISRHSSPTRLELGTLTVWTSGPSWTRELTAREDELLKRLADRLGENTIRHLTFTSA